jgi:hypothetical protein
MYTREFNNKTMDNKKLLKLIFKALQAQESGVDKPEKREVEKSNPKSWPKELHVAFEDACRRLNLECEDDKMPMMMQDTGSGEEE